MKFTAVFLDHKKIEPDDLQLMQFGGQSARIQRIKKAVQAGLCERSAPVVASHRDHVSGALHDAGYRDLAVGDLVVDEEKKIWMNDYVGWVNVTKTMKTVKTILSE